jgi:hypothetical protein
VASEMRLGLEIISNHIRLISYLSFRLVADIRDALQVPVLDGAQALLTKAATVWKMSRG